MIQFPYAMAQSAERKWLSRATIFASLSLAQWDLESNAGKALSGLNNPFGIKATAAQIAAGKARACWTHETINGAYVKKVQWFANYDDEQESFDAHAELLATSGYYIKARHDQNPRQFAIDLTGIYATGIPGHPYGQALIDIMNANNLYQYDLAIGSGAPLQDPLAMSVVGHDLWVQRQLNKAGAAPQLIEDGVAGEKTKAAIAAFQAGHGLAVDGIAGDATVKALEPLA